MNIQRWKYSVFFRAFVCIMGVSSFSVEVVKYAPSTDASDPIVQGLQKVLKCNEVKGFELLDSRWNGNEVWKYDTDAGNFFVKMNRVEDPSVFMSEAVSLSAIASSGTVTCPKPLHLGKLPKVGDIGPGSFMILEWFPLAPFGSMRPETQSKLAQQLAAMHLGQGPGGQKERDLHQNRFGFPISNFLALTPLNNTWQPTWGGFLGQRFRDQVVALQKDKVYGRAPLAKGEDLYDLATNSPDGGGASVNADASAAGASGSAAVLSNEELLFKLDRLLEGLPLLFTNLDIKPSLLHGDLWIGNTGATKEHGPVVYDPASYYGHHEMELSIMKMFGGFNDDFWARYHSYVPAEAGSSVREKAYVLYHTLNQLNLFGHPDNLNKAGQLCDEILDELS